MTLGSTKKVISNEDKQTDAFIGWLKKNKMKFNANKFENIALGKVKNVEVELYETQSLTISTL